MKNDNEILIRILETLTAPPILKLLAFVFFIYIFKGPISDFFKTVSGAIKNGGMFAKWGKNSFVSIPQTPKPSPLENKNELSKKESDSLWDFLESNPSQKEIINWVYSKGTNETHAMDIMAAFILNGGDELLEHLKCLYNEAGAIEEKIDLADLLVRCYVEIEYYDAAEKVWHELTREDVKEEYRVTINTKLAATYIDENKNDKALRLLRKTYKIAEDNKDKKLVFNTLRTLAGENNPLLSSSALMAEYNLEKEQGKYLASDKLFDLGYNLQKAELDELAVYVYTLYNKLYPRESSALNNIAISFGKLDIPGKEVSYFKKAFKTSKTDTGKNYVSNLLENGFYDEASILLEEGILDKKIAVNTALEEEVERRKAAENKKVHSILERANRQAEILGHYANCYLEHEKIDLLNVEWCLKRNSATEEPVELYKKNDELIALWSEEPKTSFTASLFGNGVNQIVPKQFYHLIINQEGNSFKAKMEKDHPNRNRRKSILTLDIHDEYFGLAKNFKIYLYKIENGQILECLTMRPNEKE